MNICTRQHKQWQKFIKGELDDKPVTNRDAVSSCRLCMAITIIDIFDFQRVPDHSVEMISGMWAMR